MSWILSKCTKSSRKTLISIIIPTLNEETGIEATLDAVLRLDHTCEVIVVDGGSSDQTVSLVRSRGIRVIGGPRGRGAQMHAGANQSQGEVLWFLHADTHPPVDAASHLIQALADQSVAGGNFALTFDGGSRPARLLTRLYPHFRKFGLAYGDSGIFVRRSVYERAGGFQPFPIFEDLDLIRRFRPHGRFIHLPCRLTTSSRRFEGRSFTWTFVCWTAMQVLYWAGIHPVALGRLYVPIRAPIRSSAERQNHEQGSHRE